MEINTTTVVATLIAFFSSCWAIFQYLDTKKREQRMKEFDNYHKLIKELVQPDISENTYIDRQIAVIYELRYLKKYHAVSYRILKGLKETWRESNNKRVLTEIGLTIAFIEKKVNSKKLKQ